MKIVANVESLRDALKAVTPFVSAKSPKPILRCIKLSCWGESAAIHATDLERSITAKLEDVTVQSSGDVLLPIEQFGQIVKQLKTDEISIETDENNVTIRSGRSKFRLATESPDEYPSSSETDATVAFEISASLLRAAIKRTVFCTDDIATRYALNGILFHVEDEALSMISTDGKRLAVMQCGIVNPYGYESENTQTIVPSDSLTVISKALASCDEMVRVYIDANKVQFYTSACYITCTLMEGRFPKWVDMLKPRKDEENATVSVDELLTAVRQGAVCCTKQSNGVDFIFANDQLTIKSQLAEVGDATIEAPIDYSGDEIKLRLNYEYVQEVCQAVEKGASLRIGLVAEKAAIFTTEDGYLYMVMPMSK
jgi:DNA polymerase-3 subunit beta